MECYKCSKDGALVYMTKPKYDDKNGSNYVECPECCRKEVVGFGIIS